MQSARATVLCRIKNVVKSVSELFQVIVIKTFHWKVLFIPNIARQSAKCGGISLSFCMYIVAYLTCSGWTTHVIITHVIITR